MDDGLQILGMEESFQERHLAEHPVEPSGESGKLRGGEVAGCRQIHVRVPIHKYGKIHLVRIPIPGVLTYVWKGSKGTTATASRFEPGTSRLRVRGLIH